MSDEKDGGPAFPVGDVKTHGTFGMSLRDWMAGMALQGLVASDQQILDGDRAQFHARWAYYYADAMLSERKKVKP